MTSLYMLCSSSAIWAALTLPWPRLFVSPPPPCHPVRRPSPALFLRDSASHRHKITAARVFPERVQSSGGLEPGRLIAEDGHYLLRPVSASVFTVSMSVFIHGRHDEDCLVVPVDRDDVLIAGPSLLSSASRRMSEGRPANDLRASLTSPSLS